MQSRLTCTSVLFLCTLWLCSFPSHAAEYRLQLANIDEQVFLRYVDTQGRPFKVAQHTLPRLVDALNSFQKSKYFVLSDYALQPVSVAHLPATQWETIQGAGSTGGTPPWTTAAWEGTPTRLALWQIRSSQRNWQELTEVAVQTDGVLRRLPVHQVPLFGRQQLAVPAMPTSYIQNTLEHHSFVTEVASRAMVYDGLSVIVGRNHDIHSPDTVYVLVQQPQTAMAYTVVLGWKNRKELERDGGNGTGPFN